MFRVLSTFNSFGCAIVKMISTGANMNIPVTQSGKLVNYV